MARQNASAPAVKSKQPCDFANRNTELLIAETRSDLLEQLHNVVNPRFNSLEKQIIDEVAVARADAETTLRRCPARPQTQQ